MTTVLIQLTIAGSETGPFNLYCVDSLGNQTGPFESNVPKAALVAGYVTTIPADCQIVRVKSNSGTCQNYIDLSLGITTTTTTVQPGSTTTTTTQIPTTTTTTVILTTTTTTSPGSTTTTSTTTSSTTTSTTSTTTSSTTTSTTTSCTAYSLINNILVGPDAEGTYIDCFTEDLIIFTIPASEELIICARTGSVVITIGSENVLQTDNGPC